MAQTHHIGNHGAHATSPVAGPAPEGSQGLSGGRVALRRTPPAIMGIGIFLAAIALVVVSAAYGSNDDSSTGTPAPAVVTPR